MILKAEKVFLDKHMDAVSKAKLAGKKLQRCFWVNIGNKV